jgi:hypothetical protein
MKWHRISIRMRPAFRRELKVHCAASGLSVTAFSIIAVREALAAAQDSAPPPDPAPSSTLRGGRDPQVLDPEFFLPDELRAIPDPIPVGYLEALATAEQATRCEDGTWVVWPA